MAADLIREIEARGRPIAVTDCEAYIVAYPDSSVEEWYRLVGENSAYRVLVNKVKDVFFQLYAERHDMAIKWDAENPNLTAYLSLYPDSSAEELHRRTSANNMFKYIKHTVRDMAVQLRAERRRELAEWNAANVELAARYNMHLFTTLTRRDRPGSDKASKKYKLTNNE